MLPKMAKYLSKIEYGDKIYERIDIPKVRALYEKMEDYVKSLDTKFGYTDEEGKFVKVPSPHGNWLKDAMQRTSFRVKHNDDVDVI